MCFPSKTSTYGVVYPIYNIFIAPYSISNEKQACDNLMVLKEQLISNLTTFSL